MEKNQNLNNDFNNLQVDDIIRNKISGDIYSISKVNAPGDYFAIREVTVKDPDEWIIISRPTKKDDDG